MDRSPSKAILCQAAFALGLIALCVIGRVVPHAWNATPVMAISLFSAWLFPRLWMGMSVPMLGMLISNAIIGTYDPYLMASVYGCFLLPFALRGLLRKRRDALTLVASALGASTAFFLITNAAVWLVSPAYPSGVGGLLMSLEAGLPFYRTAMQADVLWVVFFFTAYSWSADRAGARLRSVFAPAQARESEAAA